MENGLVHIYYGYGKGKTSAAVGQGIRACGRGLKVVLAQFLKSGNSGEIKCLNQLNNFYVFQNPGHLPFLFQMSGKEKDEYKAYCFSLFQKAVNMNCDILILDEILDAAEENLISKELIIDIISCRPLDREIIMTGHGEHKDILEYADYITFFENRKHPFDLGLKARIGIEL